MLPVLLIVLCVILRIAPHPPNFAPVGATAVFAGRTLHPLFAVLVVGVAMVAGDVFLARLHGYAAFDWVTPFIYGSFFLQLLAGRMLRQRRGGMIIAALAGSLGFFVLSNLGVFIASGMYAHSAAGLAACYLAALPFLGRTILGDILWTLILMAAYRPLAARLEARRGFVPIPLHEMA